MKKTKLTVSIVIPVYNEEEQITACLQAIAAQSVKPLEVLVVDNNSTDNTVAIARRFRFVKILREPRQGVVHARNTGFNAARGDIIGRIDADSVLQSDWVASVQTLFEDQEIAAATGVMKYNNMAASRFVNWVDLGIRRSLARRLGREVAIQGANMAMRRSVWRSVKRHTCHRAGIHEDFDLAIHTNWQGKLVIFDESMVAAIGYRQAESSWPDFCRYVLLAPKTYAEHGLKSRIYMYPVVALALSAYGLLKLLNHAYDQQTGKFNWDVLFNDEAGKARVNPATFVD